MTGAIPSASRFALSMTQTRHRLILALLFGSGALSLAYQMVWSTLLLDELGVSAYSHAAVLATFMGGLALGAAWLGRLADRVRAPLRLLAGLELGIGAYAFASPLLFEALGAFSTAWIPSTAGPASLLGRTAVAATLLLPPTILMGGTYPAALRELTRTTALIGRHAAQLYAVNAAGAVLGGLATTFALLPLLGVTGTLRGLGWGNVLLAGAAFGLAAWSVREAAAVVGEPTARRQPLRALLPEALLAATAGFVSFSLEIAWIRFFSLILGSSVYSFAIIVAAFITGIALGGTILARRRAAPVAPLRLFAWTQALLGLLLMLVVPAHPYLGGVFAHYLELFAPRPEAFFVYEGGKLLFCFALVLAPATLIGMSLPLLVQHVAHSIGRLGGDAGRVYAWNTWGNVLGALTSGLLLLPLLGMERLLRLSALLAGLVGLAAVWRGAELGARARYGVALLVGLTGLLNAFVPTWAVERLTLMTFRRGTLGEAGLEARLRGREVLMFRDDAVANIAVVRQPDPQQPFLALLSNGRTEATTHPDMPTQLLAGHLPLLLHPEPRRVLLVGLASGSTAGAVLAHDVERLDTVELVRAMPDVVEIFGPWNGRPLDDTRHRLLFEDARRFVETTSERYDVIISEPSNPWVAGVGSLFTPRFYEAALAKLAHRGIFMQWVQTYETSDETFAVAVRTLSESFPFVYGFQGVRTDALLLATREPLRPDWVALERRIETGAVARQLGTFDVRDAASLLALQRFSPASIDAIARAAPFVNTMDNRYLEQRGPRELFLASRPTLLRALDERWQSAPSLLWSEFMHAAEDRHPRISRDSRIVVAEIEHAALTALVHLEPELLLARGAASFLPPTLLAAPPPAPAALAARVLELTGTGLTGVAETLLAWYRVAILMESAVDRKLGGFWLERSKEWLASLGGDPQFRRFHVELLMATRQLAEATAELETWLREPWPPNREWAVRQACLIDREALCERVRSDPAWASVEVGGAVP